MRTQLITGVAAAALVLTSLGIAGHASAAAVASVEGEKFPRPDSRTMTLWDLTASGGQHRAFWTNAELTTSASLAGSSDSVIARVRADACNGGATFRVTVNDAVLPAATVTSATWTTVRLPAALAAGTHRIRFAFTNDYVGSGCDRNLYLDKLTFDQSTVRATATEVETWTKSYANVGAPHKDANASAGQAMYLWDTGSVTGTVTGNTGRLIVRARGEMCNGAPQLQATASGVALGTVTVDSTSYRDYDLGAFRSGTRTVRLTFTNNTGVRGVCDRNVLVDTARVAVGTSTPTSTPPPSTTPTTTPPPVPPTTGPLQPLGATRSWGLVRADEFGGTSLDRSLWTTKEPWNGAPGFQQGQQMYCPFPATDKVVQVSKGSLKLHAVEEPAGGKPLQGCFVTTRDNLSLTHGYVEARVKLPTGADLWPAFWLLGNGTNSTGCPWPCTGQIDIFEFVNNGGGNGVPYATVHWAGPCNQWNHCQKTQDSPWPAKVAGWGTDWVTFGLERTASSLTFFINGEKKYVMTDTMKNGSGQTLGRALFDNPMHVRFDISSTGDGWSNDPTKGPEAGTFEVDYLRVWR